MARSAIDITVRQSMMLLALASLVSSQRYLPPDKDEKMDPPNYHFSYEVEDAGASLEFGHSEKRENEMATGQYRVKLPDGRTQIVEYKAGPDGYQPQVKYTGEAVYPPSDNKLDGYNYNAASNQSPPRRLPAPSALKLAKALVSKSSTPRLTTVKNSSFPKNPPQANPPYSSSTVKVDDFDNETF